MTAICGKRRTAASTLYNLTHIKRFTKEQANAWLDEGKADAVAFGIPYIANPDLVERLRKDAPLNEAKPELFYAQGPVGYTDYPSL